MSAEDKYEIVAKIGQGSFGVIHKVRRLADGFIMCRKEISYQRMSQKEREQLHAEFQILSHLRHPNIVAYYHREHLKASQDLHLYMEYCGNGDLGRVIKDLLAKGQRAQESFVWSIFSQLVLALYRCHYGVDPPEVGANVFASPGSAPKVPAGAVTILHRDLKPENVFLGEDNSVKLGDFGLSKMIKSQDFASTYVGTPFYMSPEICAAEKYTLKSDIWSLGCLIHELCTREPPFNAKSHFQLVQKIKEGKVPPLPDMYSPDLYQIIKDCLRVNPDRRPDTAQLLNLPIVRLMRKEKEVVGINKALKVREEALRKKELELSERLANLEKEKQATRDEIDASLRREWEVKARLEIDRLANAEIERLQRRFEDEVKVRVEAELRKKAVSLAPPEPPVEEYHSSSMAKADFPNSSVSDEELPSTADITEYTLRSPDTPKEVKKAARTPFGRAQTMFVGTPMDIEMGSPSPMAIASLSLSPRRNGNTRPPTMAAGNIFAANAAASGEAPRWETEVMIDSDDDEIAPSPTRNIKSTQNPFTNKNRPVLSSRLKQQQQQSSSNTGLVSKTVAGSSASTAQPELRPRSPVGRSTKIPSAVSLQQQQQQQNEAGSSATTTSGGGGGLVRKPSFRKDSSEALGKMVAKNTIRGRTLVELQQARAGGRPVSVNAAGGENVSPKRTSAAYRTASTGSQPAAVWDPERDEMPSPFLARQQRIARIS